MNKPTIIILSLLFFLSLAAVYSQTEISLLDNEIETRINQALDLFSGGEYEKAIGILDNVLILDPGNKRASDLRESIKELYQMEINTSEDDVQPYEGERPDFSIQEPEDTEKPAEDLEKPDFSVRNETDEIIYPADSRTSFKISLSPNLVLPWDISEESVVFPVQSGYSGSFNVKADFFLKKWDRILGISSAYSFFLLNPDDGNFAANQLNVFDAMFSFRTFFSETVDTKIIFKLAVGYRGYFSNGYNFYTVERSYLNGFNMGINLEAPLLYLFADNEFFKKIIFDVDMNLLFFPELNTLNLFDFKIKSELRFSHLSVGIHFGAYSVITPDKAEYMWMTGLNFSFFF